MTKMHTKTGEIVFVEVLAPDNLGNVRFEVHCITSTGVSHAFKNLDNTGLHRTLNQLGVITVPKPRARAKIKAVN